MQAAGLMAAGALVAAGCGDDGSDARPKDGATTPPVIEVGDGGDDEPELDPADFVDVVDHPHMPLTPGSRWVYEGTDDEETERVEVVVTEERREILGISATVVRDTVSDAEGRVVEDTYDWFAQDREGNVWYMGEDSTEYEDGEPVAKTGSWEAGVDGAYAGIVMPAEPEVGHAYRQEFYEGEAEDVGEIIAIGAGPVTVPAGTYDDLVVTRDWNPLEPEVVEEKTYAPGVGLVLEVKTEGGAGRVELVAIG